MRNLKKFLALVLAMMMTLSLMVTVNAKNVEFDDGESVNDAFIDDLTVLAGMGVIQGMDDGSFAPQSTVTRAQMAAIVYRLRTGDASADPEYKDKSNMYAGYGDFKDVKDTSWYAGYVGYCANAGIIIGDGDGNFRPNSPVTGYEALVMLLRAMGYDQPNEFTGKEWRQHAASIATSRGLLDKVNTTVYRGTLMNGAAREVIAEITFQAATKAQVVYTAAFGYQTTGMNGGVLNDVTNPTLGKQYYGLTSDTGIVVGNQATGESYTKLSIGTTPVTNAAGAIAAAQVSGENSYEYETDATATGGNVTLEFKGETELDLFGHKVEVWYDSRTSAGVEDYTNVPVKIDSKFQTVYAYLDRASLTATVFADDLHTEQATANKPSVYSAAVAAGFSKKSAPEYESDIYSRIDDLTGAGTPANAQATQSKVGMYVVISNNADKLADVVIPLNLEVAKITQVNTTVKDGEYIYLGKGASKFGVGLITPATPNGKILMDNLAPGSDTTLGDVVTASQIIGTTDTKANLVADVAKIMYDTRKLVSTVTGTVATYTLAGTDVVSVTLDNGDKLDLSGITGANINTAPATWNFDTASHLIDGALMTLTGTNTFAGVTYTFYKDALGRFIGVTAPNENVFLYGTYADYDVGSLGTAEIKYAISGFNWDGTPVKNHALISVDQAAINGTLYNALTVSRKDFGNADPSTVGNQIKAGYDTGYMIDADGNLSTTGINGTKFTGTDDGAAAGASNIRNWVITSGDVANGFARVKNHNGTADQDYLLTENTKFVVVSGIGINATAKVYTGLKELVGTGSSTEIYGDSFDGTNVVKNNEVWFQTGEQKYGNVDTSKNNTIETVILSDKNLTQYGAQSLYFAAPDAAATTVKLAGCNDVNVKQYKLYNNGEANYYWVKDDAGVAATGTAATGDFYTLIQIDTINGQPIYRATKVTDNSGNHVGATYNYIVVNNVNTAELACGTHTAFDGVYKVENAIVAEAFGGNTPDVETNNIDSVLKLNHAVSMGKPGASGNLYTVSVAVVYNGINVSCIYVTNIENA